jgi:hypothetical protein
MQRERESVCVCFIANSKAFFWREIVKSELFVNLFFFCKKARDDKLQNFRTHTHPDNTHTDTRYIQKTHMHTAAHAPSHPPAARRKDCSCAAFSSATLLGLYLLGRPSHHRISHPPSDPSLRIHQY